ncbi:polysaccharide biosynthesis protein [Neisseria animalis]|uniref:Polysaccharide biosynthesis protein n=1 Tax=Neisseria animalis TaxID=492 RepID=A0A5P3MSM0_NEIAN|nr:nucleoside-diphosphate sugar epimerase/dehydratase [Neisseria animalis]QEY23639.1 polysaccharide biosynthesis protein [Neisseria animalis]ROW32784.1 polysaccharide biosynthesis protein [Neisseria animalis]VEE09396.1 pilin glycosylation protein [Neisseria animalis]
MILEHLLALPRTAKKVLFVGHDIMMIFAAFWFTQRLKADYYQEWSDPANWLAFAATVVPTLLVFMRLGLYRAVIRYLNMRVLAVAVAGSLSSTVFFFLSVLYFEQLRLALPVVYFVLLLVLTSGSRLLLRAVLAERRGHSVPVLIYGAGKSGRQLSEALRQNAAYRPAAFIDDAPDNRHINIRDLTVYPPSEIGRLVQKYGIRKILLALPHTAADKRAAIIRSLEPYGCEVLTIPAVNDWIGGKISAGSLQKISVSDLLGRASVAPVPELMRADISGKTVMVTGAGGSIGAELCRQIVQQQPDRLVLFELSEFALYNIERELSEFQTASGGQTEILPLLGSVQDEGRLHQIMAAFRVDTVYHAAAYKHVPLVELNTVEGIRNNIWGTLHCARAARAAGVTTFVLISTDKAVRPTNTMGASKRMAELVLQAMAAEPGQTTRFCMVRFGNVLGSSGSVVPLFEQQISRGGPITLTHPDITRYFMTIPEAAQLVIQAGAMGKGGDVFVLDMGEPVRIMDLAEQMIRLSGMKLKNSQHPEGDIEIRISGLRPGEKLYEELLIGDNVSPTGHPRILTANETMLPAAELGSLLERIDTACRQADQAALRALLLEAPTGFAPKDGICDLLWQQKAV